MCNRFFALPFPSFVAIAGISFVLAGSRSAAANPAGIANVDPFFGQYFESFNEFPLQFASQLPTFEGNGDLRTDNGSQGLIITTQDSIFNDTVTAQSGAMVGQFSIVDWDFYTPVAQFGGYWQNNGGASDAVVQFFDASNQSLGSVTATAPFPSNDEWVWNGWSFTTPVSRVQVTGNGFSNGFTWYDDMQMNPAPEPAVVLMAAPWLLVPRRRRRGLWCGL